jgi:hypothetical protein
MRKIYENISFLGYLLLTYYPDSEII